MSKKNDLLKNEDSLVGKIKKININQEIKKSFLSYAMSVIVARALPDIKDGLKPVQRRILYGMNELGVYSHSSYKKSARIVGDVMGKFHPHGDSSIYEAMIRMAQDFNYRYPLVDGHGNLGSIDGDNAAAMRYTEVKMSKISMELLKEIDQETVDFVENYDGSEREPVFLPSSFPNLLVNGSTGIAVGMATNIPSHNLSEVIDALINYIDNKEIDTEGLMKFIKGPDFPTGGEILGISGLKEAYETGRGRIFVRSKTEIIYSDKNKPIIIIKEIPYQIKKTSLIEKIAFLVKEKIIEGITDLRDESNNSRGMRIIIELRKDVEPKIILNNLYKHTQLQTSFCFNMIALVNGVPKIVSLKNMLEEFFLFRIDVINRQKKFELNKAKQKKHLITALAIILNDIEKVLKIIKNSNDVKEAQKNIMINYNFDEIQSKAILEMSLQKITNLEIKKVIKEEEILKLKIYECENIINSQTKKEKILKKELLKIKNQFQDKRKSIISNEQYLTVENESLINKETILITVTNKGYIKRLNLDTYKKQNRGGKGVSGLKMQENDFLEHILITSTHDHQLFFTNKGKIYQLKGYEIPLGSRYSKGIPLVNLLPLEKNEFLTSLTSVKDFKEEKNYLVLVTKKGLIKRNSLKDFENVRRNGKIAAVLKNNDEVLFVSRTTGQQDIILAASDGKAIRFNEFEIRQTGRKSSGVRGIKIKTEEEIIGMTVVDSEKQNILVITEKGYGKITKANEYRNQIRGGKGTKTLKITSRNGKLVRLLTIYRNEELIIFSDHGKVVRIDTKQIPLTKSKVTQGNILISLEESDKVSSVALIKKTLIKKEESNDETLIEIF
ncbi:DNA gyrase, alpha subunit [Candidatus Phytoplasma mali]|uniref:DNA gyrase subunit A n=1 Tax=Phytoplasma mali (strain AT) TaxID=482235 RepID=B3R0L9_PHYMT|nr:DNA gyrase subunit A [Candidatus Phytoplasma mali]CAP18383.1 DNA gyrase, alpha subunit [Candidatus Phytoplasma mali]